MFICTVCDFVTVVVVCCCLLYFRIFVCVIRIEICLTRDMTFLYRFPLHRRHILETWVRNINSDGFVPTRTSHLCGQHFLPSMFTEGSFQGKRKCLKVDAVPTGLVSAVSLYNSYLWILVAVFFIILLLYYHVRLLT